MFYVNLGISRLIILPVAPVVSIRMLLNPAGLANPTVCI